MGWSVHQNIDMCGQGDVEIIWNWHSTHSIEDLKRIVEQKGYSAFSVPDQGLPGRSPHAALKQFSYQLTAGHCKPSRGYTNTLYIYSGGGSGGGYAAAAAGGAGGGVAGWQVAKNAYDSGAFATGAPTTGHLAYHAAEFAVGEAVGAVVAGEAAGAGAAAAAVSAGCSIQ